MTRDPEGEGPNIASVMAPSTSHDVAGAPARHAVGLPYLGGIDGLRAVSVLAVIAYHGGVTWMSGGFLGVEVFFVISGYLITSLLVAEHRRTGTVSLTGFWRRRARRLLPGLFTMLALVVLAAFLFAPDALSHLRRDVPAALLYVSNWSQLLHHDSYFVQAGRPPLLSHLWSLAVEEQFYLFVPVLGLLLLPRVRRHRLAIGAVILGLLSAVAMAVAYNPEVDPTRVYVNSLLRLSGLLLGVALGLWWSPDRLRAGRAAPRAGIALDGLALAGLLVLAWSFWRVNEWDPFVYRGGFVIVDAATLAVIAAVVHPATRMGSVLGAPPLRAIGQRSYGLYLWHWPVFQLTRPGLDLNLSGWQLALLRLALVGVLTEASYRFVEQPIRHGLLARRWATGVAFRQRDIGVALGWMLFVAMILAVGPLIRPDDSLTSQTVSSSTPDQGLVDLVAPPTTTTSTAPTTTVAPTTTAATAGAPTAVPATAPAPTAAPTSPPPTSPPPTQPPAPTTTFPPGAIAVTAIGDSVMLGAKVDMQKTIPQIAVDAAVARQFGEAAPEAIKLATFGALGPTVVVHLGTNGPMTDHQLDVLMRTLGPRRVLFLTCKVPRPWQDLSNQRIDAAAGRWKNMVVLDWLAESTPHPEWFEQDGTHLNGAGRAGYTAFIKAHLG